MITSVSIGLSERISEGLKDTENLSPSLLVSASYDGERKTALLKFYEPNSQTIHIWYDKTGHKPYCYSKLSPHDIPEDVKKRSDVLDLKEEKKQDLLNDRPVLVTKIVATDPLAIGGSPGERSIRDRIEAWEADIKYYENFLYDRRWVVGTYYRIEDSKILPLEHEIPGEVKDALQGIVADAKPDFRPYIMEWADLLNQPLPEMRRVALDIEVLSEEQNRVPDPRSANLPIISAAMVGNDGAKEVFVLRRKEVEVGKRVLDDTATIEMFDDEKALISRIFHRVLDYPFLVTFNGDDFDLHYLYNRAQKPQFGFRKDEIPISMGRDVAFVKHGVHLDLYKTFVNKSIQVYAFGNKYVDHTLGGVSEGLIQESKIEFEGALNDLPLHELARYCFNDASITYKLTSFSDDLLMKLLLVISRIAKMPIDDAARLGVSNWIRSMMFFEHRRMGALIPRREELEQKGGASTEAIIKGKKYKGGLVVEPTSGVHFGVSVLDFASLYPSIIKVYNLSYETVRCPHEECRSNLIPETDHWVCKRRIGISSLLFGSLRDLRVSYYKPLSKDSRLGKAQRELHNVVSQALKVILNASYGVMGADTFPLYCLPVADATAAIGRYAITKTIDKCRELGIEVVYGDTDSLFLKSPSVDQIEAVRDWAESALGIELDVEKTYRYVAFSQRKKNYLGVMPDGSVDVKGLTGKKSNVPPFIRRAFYEAIEILSRVSSPSDFELARDGIKKMVHQTYLSLRNRQIPLADLAFNVMIGKPPSRYVDTTPQHVKAAQLLIRTGKEVKAGEIISFVKTTTPPGVKPVSMARVEEIDVEKYLEYLRSTFDQFLDSLGYEFDEILGATRLEDFFWSR